MRFKLLNVAITVFTLCAIITQSTSAYKGVCWNKECRKWTAVCKQNYGGMFENELDAARRVNELCEELKIPLQNPGISAIPTQPYQKSEKTSQYKGVSWIKKNRKWLSYLVNAGKLKYGGTFNGELDAARRVNQLCEELEIPLQNPGISSIPMQQYQKKEKTSQYTGVDFNRNKWRARLCLKGTVLKYGGEFEIELDAAIRVNQLCKEFGIPLQNHGISSIPTQQYHIQKTSNYTGVSWKNDRKKWQAILNYNKKRYYGGYFDREEDAAKKINELRDKIEIERQNTKIDISPNKTQSNTYQSKDENVMKASEKGNFEITKFLVDNGADPNAQGKHGYTVLTMASENGNFEMVKFLVENGTHPNGQDQHGWTALMMASKKGNFEIAKFLVENGADPNVKNNSGSTKIEEERISRKSQKRKRKEDSAVVNDDVKEEKVQN